MKALTLANRICKVISMSTNTQKHGPDDVPVAYLDLTTTIQVEDMVRLAANYSQDVADRWKALLIQIKHDLGGELQRFLEHNITGITFMGEFKHHQVTIDAPGVPRLKFADVKLCKFSVAFDYEDHSLVMHFQMQTQPNQLLDELAATMKRTITVHIEPPDEKQLKLIMAEAGKIAAKGKKEPAADDAESAAEKGNAAAKVGRAFKDAVDGRKGFNA